MRQELESHCSLHHSLKHRAWWNQGPYTWGSSHLLFDGLKKQSHVKKVQITPESHQFHCSLPDTDTLLTKQLPALHFLNHKGLSVHLVEAVIIKVKHIPYFLLFHSKADLLKFLPPTPLFWDLREQHWLQAQNGQALCKQQRSLPSSMCSIQSSNSRSQEYKQL